MVTHNAAILEENQPLAEESPQINQQRKRHMLNNEVRLQQCCIVFMRSFCLRRDELFSQFAHPFYSTHVLCDYITRNISRRYKLVKAQ
jgi:hypothetical protein